MSWLGPLIRVASALGRGIARLVRRKRQPDASDVLDDYGPLSATKARQRAHEVWRRHLRETEDERIDRESGV